MINWAKRSLTWKIIRKVCWGLGFWNGQNHFLIVISLLIDCNQPVSLLARSYRYQFVCETCKNDLDHKRDWPGPCDPKSLIKPRQSNMKSNDRNWHNHIQIIYIYIYIKILDVIIIRCSTPMTPRWREKLTWHEYNNKGREAESGTQVPLFWRKAGPPSRRPVIRSEDLLSFKRGD